MMMNSLRMVRYGFLLVLLGACGDTAPAPSEFPSTGDVQLSVLQQRVATLQARITRIRDVSDIKRVQRAYGYYMDKGQWDQVVDLFADDAELEIGRDGVFRGKARIAEYFQVLGEGRQGLAPGQLNEHMMLMPVVTLAEDGMTARARWRGIMMLGRHGDHAWWGEGPYENQYVKQDGVWKLRRLHWFQTIVVPYEGGWSVHADVNQGHYVAGRLAPDAPPSVAYEPWPETFLPAFHFDNPVQSRYARLRAGQALPGDEPVSASGTLPADMGVALAEIGRQTAGLEAAVVNLEDEKQLENLQRIFGFYIDKNMWTEAADLFADDGSLEIGGSGIYQGKERVRAYLQSLGGEGPQHGILNDHMQLQPVITLLADGSARGRWRHFSQEAVQGESHHWGSGIYENTYVKQDGVWKINNLHLFSTMRTPYDDGWAITALPRSEPSTSLPPDLPPSVDYENYPAVFVVPYHYPHPVTAPRPWAEVEVEPLQSLVQVENQLEDLERRVSRLRDHDEIEYLQSVYGYYLARNQWDELAGIFAEDGTIEIALRGVYVGRASVRRNLDLYGEQGELPGILHNHMQFQPVIHVAADGLGANMRSRAFSMMGGYGESGRWMGGVYENTFSKRDGIWQIQTDQVFNTYFAFYDQGWRDLAPRLAPGISEDNPPDLPPSMHFDMYPLPFLPPYHYSNPVTGKDYVLQD